MYVDKLQNRKVHTMKATLFLAMLMILPLSAHAQVSDFEGDSSVVDTNTPDEETFDDAIGTTDPVVDDNDGGGGGVKPPKKDKKDKVKKKNFGQIVSAEAKRLRGDKTGFGEWVKNHPEHPGANKAVPKPESANNGAIKSDKGKSKKK